LFARKREATLLAAGYGNHEEYEHEHHPLGAAKITQAVPRHGLKAGCKPPQRKVIMSVKLEPKAGGSLAEPRPEQTQIPELTLFTDPLFKVQKLLVPVDFSDCSRKALQYALPFAKHFGAELVLLHVVEPYPLVPEMAPYDMENIHDGRKDLQALQTAIGDVAPSTGLIRTGLPHLEISAAARELGIDLIIISTHGRKGLSRRIFGSTTEKVVRYAPCPVLIVREREHDFI
jgi:universal stress protein A